MSSKQEYSKPSVTRMGPVVEKTEGGFFGNVVEIMSFRRIG